MSERGLCPPGVGGLTADTGRSAAHMQWARVLLRGGPQYRQSTEGTVFWIKPQLPTLARRSQPATTPLSSPLDPLYSGPTGPSHFLQWTPSLDMRVLVGAPASLSLPN